MDITPLLQAAQSPDATTRTAAEEQLKAFQAQNYQGFLTALAAEVATEGKAPEARRLAGLILKNALAANDAARKAELANQWVALDPALRSQIKQSLLTTLTSTVADARAVAAQVVAKVAAIEVPRQEWGELIPSLLSAMSSPQSDSGAKQATLQALGYLCEEVDSSCLQQEQVNSMLTAVVQGMRKEEPDAAVRLAATEALLNALEFAAKNFENENERNYIMQCTCEATLCEAPRVRQAAYECLVAIAGSYYDKLLAYITDIFHLTSKAIREDEEPVALQAIEFWSTVAEEELDLADYQEEGVVNHGFIKKALKFLTPILLETLTKQDEEAAEDEDVWNVATAGGTCLSLVANVAEDEVVPLVMPFVQENVSSQDWRRREAATFAFGSVLEGPSVATLAPLVQQAIPFMLRAMNDPNNQVKDSTAWTLGRIFEFLHGPGVEPPVLTAQLLPSILGVLLESLGKDVPHVATKVCWAIHNLAAGYLEHSDEATSPLSPFFQSTVQTLLAVSERADAVGASGGRLRQLAYETLNESIRCSARDTENVVLQVIPVVIGKLNQTFEVQVSTEDGREKLSELQGLLCGTLTVIISKLGGSPTASAPLMQFADSMVQLFLRVFASQSTTVHEEAMLAMGALAFACGEGFLKYMQAFAPYLEAGLKNAAHYQVCAVTVGVVGDICRALEEKALPWCNGIVYQLLQNLQSEELRMQVKPPILSCFGDIALAVGPAFETYLPYVVPMLQSAAQLSVQTSKAQNQEEMAEYNNTLRTGIFEAYAGLLMGFKKDKAKAEMLKQHADGILAFIQEVFADAERDGPVTSAAMGVMGDLADTMDGIGPLFAARPFYKEFLMEGLASGDEVLKEQAGRAQACIAKAVQMAGVQG
mmetsp:Transcript_8298/g.29142  ORF Transcript_8298/g.29142 Transcript_8298/m.29142 type:complete len:878 (-) Transcript_8298:27-2660(-)